MIQRQPATAAAAVANTAGPQCSCHCQRKLKGLWRELHPLAHLHQVVQDVTGGCLLAADVASAHSAQQEPAGRHQGGCVLKHCMSQAVRMMCVASVVKVINSQAGQDVAGPLHSLIQVSQRSSIARLLGEPCLQERHVIKYLRTAAACLCARQPGKGLKSSADCYGTSLWPRSPSYTARSTLWVAARQSAAPQACRQRGAIHLACCSPPAKMQGHDSRFTSMSKLRSATSSRLNTPGDVCSMWMIVAQGAIAAPVQRK